MARAKGHERKKRLHAMNRHDDGPIALKSKGLGADRTKTMTRRRVSSIRHRNSFARVTAQCGKSAEKQQSRFVGLGRNSELGDPISSLLEVITMSAHTVPHCHIRAIIRFTEVSLMIMHLWLRSIKRFLDIYDSEQTG